MNIVFDVLQVYPLQNENKPVDGWLLMFLVVSIMAQHPDTRQRGGIANADEGVSPLF